MTVARWNGREVNGPAVKVAVGVFVVAGLLLGLVLLLVVAPVVLVLAALLHPVLRALGRRGTFRTEDGRALVCLDGDAFRRAGARRD